jgi:hypothetical protein
MFWSSTCNYSYYRLIVNVRHAWLVKCAVREMRETFEINFWRWRLCKKYKLSCDGPYGGVWNNVHLAVFGSQVVRFVLERMAGIWLQSPWRRCTLMNLSCLEHFYGLIILIYIEGNFRLPICLLYKPVKGRSQWPRGLTHRFWPLGYWDNGLESRSRHGCFSLCFCVVLSCVGRGLCDGLITLPRGSHQVPKIDYETSGVRRPRSLQGLESHWWWWIWWKWC